MYLLPLSYCKVLKEFLELIQSYQDVPFSGPKWPICPEKKFFVQTIIITFIYLLALFIVQDLQNILTADPKIRTFFGPKMIQLLRKKFFGKLLKSLSSNYQPLSLCKISKKSFQPIQSYEDTQFLSLKWSICPNDNFFRKPVNEPCSFYSCLSTYQKSK